ncbi:hypothetical protein [Dictyobacter arantiisoli]|uniref:TrbL/VirB6 plasmid conjugal transfer protein n=1 Tax=Dictyobacter arantiisoli TaxID=2014874 RepID=A0A5A5T600_9CHLR|nr:hypothetical protein [Dictyobacter arantiisoli]GCF06798.1 hypothetical protein KDI_03620 [Dictyobacter arantiisoli]
MKERLQHWHALWTEKSSSYLDPLFGTEQPEAGHRRPHLRHMVRNAIKDWQQASEPAPKKSIWSRLLVTLACFAIGFLLLLNTHPVAWQASSTTSANTRAASAQGIKLPSYQPGKGAVNDTNTLQCNLNEPASYYFPNNTSDSTKEAPNNPNGGCAFSTANYSCSYDPLGSANGNGDTFASCTINGVFYECPITDDNAALSTLTCRDGNGHTCNITNCPINGPCINTGKTDAITGLPIVATPTVTSGTASPESTDTLDVCPLPVKEDCTTIAAGGNDVIGGTTGLLSTTPDTSTYNSAQVTTAWQSVLLVVGGLVAFALTIAGYRVMLSPFSTRYATSAETIGRVVIAGVAAIVSLFFIGELISILNAFSAVVKTFTFNNGLSGDFSTAFASFSGNSLSSVGVPSSRWGCNVQQFFGNVFNMSVYNLQAARKDINATQHASLIFTASANLINHIPDYLLTLMTILLAIQLMLRLVFVNGYIVISPLIIFCSALPGALSSGILRRWLHDFLALLAVQFIQLFAAVVIILLFDGAQAAFGTSWPGQLIARFLPIISMMIILNIPRLLNSSATTLLSSITSSISGSITGITLIIRGL